MSAFEIIMLLCFGFAWPFSIYKSFASRSTKGRSLAFLLIIASGYVAGILHKIFFNYDDVTFFYVANLVMVVANIFVYLRNRFLEKRLD